MAHTCTTTLAKNPLRGSGDEFGYEISETYCLSSLGEEEEKYEEKKFVASDGSYFDYFGSSCSISDDLVVIGAFGVDGDHFSEGAAYLFHLDGTEVAKLAPGDDVEDDDFFGASVSMDEKIVVGTPNGGDYVRVFSRYGMYERTIRCDDCTRFGERVATLGNLIAVNGKQNDIWKLFLYTKEGEFIKSLEQGSEIDAVAISEQFIVSTFTKYGSGKTIIYSNTSPDFPKIAEINQGGTEVAVSGDKLVIGDSGGDGAAYLYKTDGTLVKTLDRQDASSDSYFGGRVAITHDKVLVGASGNDDQGARSGSVFIYSAATGELIKKVLAPDGKAGSYFGSSVCASDSYFVVGAQGVDSNGFRSGAAYLFQFSEQ